MSWIKMRTDLRNHPKVVRLASALKTDRLRTLGALQVVWSAFDTHSTDGLLDGYTIETIDEDTFAGFGAALQQVKWLEVVEGGLRLPEFDTHNGASAKKRALDSKLKKSGREADKSANGSWTETGQMSGSGNGQMSGTDADISRTRVRLDKRKKIPPTPKGEPDGFDAFWSTYPKNAARKDAVKAFAKLAPEPVLLAAMLVAVRRQAASEQWRKGGGQFIPNAATWLNGRRWEDESPKAERSDDIFAGAL